MEQSIKVLTLHQPYATLLAHGIKKNETRPKPTSHTFEKGIYLIHASKKWTYKQFDICMTEPFFSELCKLGYWYRTMPLSGFTFPTGCIVGSFEVKECRDVVGYDTDLSTMECFKLLNKGDDDMQISFNDIELKFGDYSLNRSIWIGQNHRVLENPMYYKGGQGYYQNFKGNINDLKFK